MLIWTAGRSSSGIAHHRPGFHPHRPRRRTRSRSPRARMRAIARRPRVHPDLAPDDATAGSRNPELRDKHQFDRPPGFQRECRGDRMEAPACLPPNPPPTRGTRTRTWAMGMPSSWATRSLDMGKTDWQDDQIAQAIIRRRSRPGPRSARVGVTLCLGAADALDDRIALVPGRLHSPSEYRNFPSNVAARLAGLEARHRLLSSS